MVALIGFVAWLIWELTERHPIVDLSLFTRRNFAWGRLRCCLGYAVFFGNIVLLPLWLQTQLGYTATWAGLVAAPAGVVSVLVSPIRRRPGRQGRCALARRRSAFWASRSRSSCARG